MSMLNKVAKQPSGSREVAVDLPALNIRRIQVTLVGDTPLIVHRWSEKAKKELLDRQMQKAKPKKGARDPDQDFKDCIYHLNDDGRLIEPDSDGNYPANCKYGFPTIGFKAAAVTACTSIGSITKVQARQAFHIDGEFAIIEGSQPKKREDMVRIAMGTADIRFRPEFFPWHTTLTIAHNANVMSPEQILNMLNTAGFGVGVGEWRPEKDGQNGRFHVATDVDMGALHEHQDKVQHVSKKLLTAGKK